MIKLSEITSLFVSVKIFRKAINISRESCDCDSLKDKQFFVFQSHTSKFAKESTEKVLKRIIYENGKGVSRRRLVQVHVECM